MNRFKYPQSLWTRTALAALTLFAVAFPVFGQGQEEKPKQDPPKQDLQESIKIPTGLVTVPVIVTDRYGRFATGLTFAARLTFATRRRSLGRAIAGRW